MDQLRYNDEKARLSYTYANHTALQRFGAASTFIDISNVQEAAEHAVLATSAFLSAGPDGSWTPLAMAVAFCLAGYEADECGFTTLKPGLQLLANCPQALRAYGELCVKGERKYARGNYRLGAPVSHYCDSGLRHLNALLRGTTMDPELEVPHITCAFWNLWQALDQPTWRDDRLPMVQVRPSIADAYASPARVPEGGPAYAFN